MKLKKGGMEIRELEEHKLNLSKGMKRLKEVNVDGENHVRAIEHLAVAADLIGNSEIYERSAQIEALKNIKNTMVEIKAHYSETVEKPKEEIENEMKDELVEMQEQEQNLEDLKASLNSLEGKGNTEAIIDREKVKAVAKVNERKNAYLQVKEFNTAVLQNEIDRFRLSQNVMKGQYGERK